MNDVAFAPNGGLWITDTGPDRGASPPDTTHDMDAVWRVESDGRVHAAARGLSLDRPDGIVLDGNGVIVATFGASRLERVGAGMPGNWSVVASLPSGKVDGLRRLPDGSLVVTSWDAGTVWEREPNGELEPLMRDVKSPAGVAVDTRRHRLAVTSMQGNALYLMPLR
jgi:sugar lactone lactonase YvrE